LNSLFSSFYSLIYFFKNYGHKKRRKKEILKSPIKKEDLNQATKKVNQIRKSQGRGIG
jgi:hypothetical protein